MIFCVNLMREFFGSFVVPSFSSSLKSNLSLSPLPHTVLFHSALHTASLPISFLVFLISSESNKLHRVRRITEPSQRFCKITWARESTIVLVGFDSNLENKYCVNSFRIHFIHPFSAFLVITTAIG
jgi:hypothetical protein